MKLILTILFFWAFAANATKYYVSNAGSDAANGLTTATSWQHVSKVNSTATTGDSVLFNDGDSWNEQLIPGANNIYYGSYGTGNKPIITGFQTLSGLTNVGNIWSGVAASSVKNLNCVLVNGKIQAKGRYPNAGTFLTFTSHSGDSSITGSLTGTPSYAGKELVIRTQRYIYDVTKVKSQSTGTLNFSPKIEYAPVDGNGYFFQNDSTFLDVQGEWSCDSATKKFCVYSTALPTVLISTIDTLVWVKHSNITFDGLSFTGANKATFQIDTANYPIIKNCSINYSGWLAISGLKSTGVTVQNDSIQNSLSGAVYLSQPDPYTPTLNVCDSVTITNCYIKNTGFIAGMGMNDNERYIAIRVVGAAPQITNNTLDSSGYIGIKWNGKNALIKNNFITNSLFVKDDGGGIYCYVGSTYWPNGYNNGSSILSNIVLNGIGAPAGATGNTVAPNIYIDDNTTNVTVDSNSIYNSAYAGILLNNNDSNTITHNNIYNALGDGILIATSFSSSGTIIKQNAIFINSSSKYILSRTFATSLGNLDSNRYSRTANEANSFNLNGTPYNLSGWQSATSKDAHSTGTPTGITSDIPLFNYNAGLSDKTTSLNASYTSLRNNAYPYTITQHSFTSTILFTKISPFLRNRAYTKVISR